MSKEHITANVKRIEEIFHKAAERIDALKLGERLPVTALAADLGKEYSLTGAQLYPVISLLLGGYPGVVVLKGARGGIAKINPDDAPHPMASRLIESDSDDPSENKTLPIVNT